MGNRIEDWRLRREKTSFRIFGLAVLLGLGTLIVWRIKNALLVIFAAILLAIFLDGLARLIGRFLRLGHLVSLVLGVLLLVALFTAFFLLAGYQIDQQLSVLGDQLPRAIDRVKELLRQFSWGRVLLYKPPDASDLVSSTGGLVGKITGLFSATLGALVMVPLGLIVGLHLAAAPGRYVAGLLLLIPPGSRARGEEVLRALGRALRWWLVGQLASMVVVGALTGVGLWLIGSPMALALGLITGLLSFIPMLGAILAALPAVLIALMDDPVRALYVALVYSGAHLLEGILITPLIQHRTVTILPAMLIAAQLVMGLLLGFVGVLLAAPLSVAVMVLVQMLYVHDLLKSDVRVLGNR